MFYRPLKNYPVLSFDRLRNLDSSFYFFVILEKEKKMEVKKIFLLFSYTYKKIKNKNVSFET